MESIPKVQEIYLISKQIEQLHTRISKLKSELIDILKTNGETRKQFSFTDKNIAYISGTEPAGISYALVKEALDSQYPELSDEIMKAIKAHAKSKNRHYERIEIRKHAQAPSTAREA